MAVQRIRIWTKYFQVYGVRRVWRPLQREGFAAARCTVERLARRLGLRGAIRGVPVCNTISYKAAPSPRDRVNWQSAPSDRTNFG